MIYQSIKLSNGIWGLVEIKLTPGSSSITLSFKSRVMEIAQAVFQVPEYITRILLFYYDHFLQVYDAILHN